MLLLKRWNSFVIWYSLIFLIPPKKNFKLSAVRLRRLCQGFGGQAARLASQSKIRFCFRRKIPEFAPIDWNRFVLDFRVRAKDFFGATWSFEITVNRKTYNKLIRDKIPEIIKKDNAVPKVSELDDNQFKVALKEKLVEEAKELLEAKTDKEILNELSDVLQLLESIALNNNIAIAEVKKQKEKKEVERGGFEKKLFLEYVDEP